MKTIFGLLNNSEVRTTGFTMFPRGFKFQQLRRVWNPKIFRPKHNVSVVVIIPDDLLIWKRIFYVQPLYIGS